MIWNNWKNWNDLEKLEKLKWFGKIGKTEMIWKNWKKLKCFGKIGKTEMIWKNWKNWNVLEKLEKTEMLWKNWKNWNDLEKLEKLNLSWQYETCFIYLFIFLFWKVLVVVIMKCLFLVMYFSHRRKVPDWLKGELTDGYQQKRALPEDLTLFAAPGFENLHRKLDITWFRGLNHSELYQVLNRTCSVLYLVWNRNKHEVYWTNRNILCIKVGIKHSVYVCKWIRTPYIPIDLDICLQQEIACSVEIFFFNS